MKNFKPDSPFLLNPNITFLNFGSFGACPKPVFDDYQKWQLELEREPIQFIAFKSAANLKSSREALAGYINCEADDLVYVTNPSYAVNIVARSLNLKPGDEILTTNLEYGACDKIWNFVCKKTGAKYIRQKIELPLTSKEKFVDDFFKGLSANTKIVFIGQITSATALILPVKEICEIAKQKGLMTIIDGAHVPGHIPLNLSELKADIYTAACHKWMMAPKGCSFLYVKKEFQHLLDPLVVSWGYESATPSHSQFLDYHQMQGTRDFSAFLTIPACLRFMQENNWEQISNQCKELVLKNAARFCQLVKSQPLCPLSNEFLGQMFSIPVKCKEPEKLQRLLYEKYKIEIPVARLDEKTFIRYSINAYNSQEDLDKLYAALDAIMTETDLIEI
ncbi:MAG: aminotransferase class V-fold PLP-dependent enzyme [Bacteroidia bacterium]|nr:aminotransferase class V-fold PLP-dependent enzyme [Bacteroidia bacterium]